MPKEGASPQVPYNGTFVRVVLPKVSTEIKKTQRTEGFLCQKKEWLRSLLIANEEATL